MAKDAAIYEALLADIIGLAYQAGAQIMAIYTRADFAVQDKADASPLTAADLASHQTLCQGLRQLTPEVPILSEESAQIPYAERSQWQRYWLIDPLDGTKEFIKRNGEFTVNIALIESGRATLGVVLIPATGQCYSALLDVGAWRQDHPDQTPQTIQVTQPFAKPLRVVGSRSHTSAELTDYVDKLNNTLGTPEFIAIGSALKFCLVAEGSADVYPRLGLTSEWDTAAAQCVVEAAGGQVVDLNGQPLRYNQKESLLNPHFLVFGDQNHNWLQYCT